MILLRCKECGKVIGGMTLVAAFYGRIRVTCTKCLDSRIDMMRDSLNNKFRR